MNNTTPNGEVSLSNEELIEKAQQWITELRQTDGAAWTLRIPVDFNHDPDVLFLELCKRLERYASLTPQPVEQADVVGRNEQLSCGCTPMQRTMITFTRDGDYCGGCGKLIPDPAQPSGLLASGTSEV